MLVMRLVGSNNMTVAMEAQYPKEVLVGQIIAVLPLHQPLATPTTPTTTSISYLVHLGHHPIQHLQQIPVLHTVFTPI